MLVREKETRMKETMSMMGMTNFSYWLSWYVYYSLITSLVAILAWCVMLINVIENSQPLTMLIFLICYAQALFAQIACISSFFENSKNSGLLGSLVYFGLQIIAIPVLSPKMPPGIKIFFSIIP